MDKRFWGLFGAGVALAVVLGAGTALLVAGGADGERMYSSPRDLPADVVAFVSDAPSDASTVTTTALKRALRQTAAQQGMQRAPEPGDRRYEELRKMALNGILEMIWLEGEAAEMGVSVSAAEASKKKREIKSENFETASQYEEFLGEAHYTEADIDRRVRAQALSAKLQERLSGMTPDPDEDEIRAYYEENRATQFTSPADREEPGRVKSLSTVRSQIRSSLKQQAEQEKFSAFVRDFNAKWRSRTVCAPAFATDKCANGNEPKQAG